MKKFKIFIVDDERMDGGTVHVENDVVISNSARKPLPNNPDGWDDMAIGWERNMDNYGIVRNFSLALGFVRDGAKILRKTFYTENVERKLALVITKLSLTLTNLKFAFNYVFLYRGDLDISTIQDAANKVTINIMEGGISALLKANEGTVYDTPFKNDPDAKDLYCDGIPLFQRVNYGIVDGIHYTNPFRNIAIGMVELSTEGKSAEVVEFDQTFDEISGTIITGLDDYRHTSENYFIKNTGSTVVLATLKGRVYLRCNSIAWSIGAFTHNVYLLVCSNDDGAAIDRYTITEPVIGQTYTIDLNLATFLNGIVDQRYFFIFQTENGAATFDFEFMPDSTVYSSFISRFAPSYIKFFTLYDYYRKLVGKITGDPEDGVSSLLASNLNICITCGDAIRGFKDVNGISSAVIKSKMTDLFTAANVQFNAGMGVEGNKITLEEKAHYYDFSNPIPLGEVKARPKNTFAKDLMANTFRIGMETQDYDDINGRDEFNNTYLFNSDITRVVKEFSLISPYRRDCYGFEYTRINFDGKVTTDSDSDNDVWLVNVGRDLSVNFLVIPYLTIYESVAPNLFKLPGSFLPIGTILVISGSPYNNGTYTVVNISNVVVGFTLVTVAEPITTQNGDTSNRGAVYTNRIEPYYLKRGTYDIITGLLSPDGVFNLEDMTAARLMRIHGNWIRSMMQGFEDSFLYFRSTEKNKELFTSKDGVIYDEDADVRIRDLAAPLFNPRYFEIEVKVPIDLPAALENNPSKCFSFTWQGTIYKGFLMKAGISLSDNAQQIFKLLSTPDNDFSKLT